LVARPVGWPKPSDLALVTVALEPGPDEALVRNTFCSVDPYMRGRMNDVQSYAPPYQLGEVMYGGAIGEVVSAPDGSGLAPGDVVTHQLGWREFALGPPAAFGQLDVAPGISLSAYLGVLGMPGLTAFVGLYDIAAIKEGDVAFVSGAAGAVGSLVGQLARMRGARKVIGSAGSREKVDVLTGELGFDAAFNYRDGNVNWLLADVVGKEGIDVYFDNVGGDHLEAAITALNPFGRVAMCGAISQYNAESPPPGPCNLAMAVGKRLRLQGFIVSDHLGRLGDFMAKVEPAVRDGRIRYRETVVEGIENMVDALLGMLRGDNIGKMVVRVS
jgi:NADPH-dependent curcumin reductase CurA